MKSTFAPCLTKRDSDQTGASSANQDGGGDDDETSISKATSAAEVTVVVSDVKVEMQM